MDDFLSNSFGRAALNEGRCDDYLAGRLLSSHLMLT